MGGNMKKKNLEKKVVSIGSLINRLDQPKEEIGLNHMTYLHPCMRRISYLTKEELGLLKRYPKNERANHKRSRGYYK